ncbi:MAG TPA: hypothetical protein VGM72_05350 [Micropepsaceae bacterium]|jgi:hypothetical protein
MPAMNSITDRIQSISARVERYRHLAEALYDRRIAAEVSRVADELEADLRRLERWQHFSIAAPAPTALAS